MPLDETDHRLGRLDPNNTPSMRVERILKDKIAKLEVKMECEN